MPMGRGGTVAALGTAQTLAWASTYYLPAILATAMARDLGVATPTIFAAFSAALLISALFGPKAGALIDRLGGRPVLMGANVVFAAGLATLALADGGIGLFAGWLLIGAGMGAGLYEAAFAALVRLYGKDARGAITGITLIAGFASTVGWPLSTFLEAKWGWRNTCFAWCAMHLLVGLPLNALLPRALPVNEPDPNADRSHHEPVEATNMAATLLLSSVFASTWFISTAMAAHLPRLLEATGVTLATAVVVGTLIGPAQVGARLLEFGFLRKVHPLLSARLAAALHPIGALALLIVGPPAAALFGILHGAGNGVLTIAKGTLPLVIFGPAGYGQRQGLLMVPARIAQALAPWLFGLALDRWGSASLLVSAVIGASALVALRLLAAPSSGN